MHNRIVKEIKKSISQLDLNLSGLNILTEVGTNHYLYAPIIPALAGANKVFAWCRDTQYGKALDIVRECEVVLSQLELEHVVEFNTEGINKNHLRQTNIITNSGSVRPINEDKLKIANNKDCVIPLMYESWEIRETDIDLAAAQKLGFTVAGTSENHPDLKVFNHFGALAAKMIFNMGFEVFNNKIAIYSNDEFGEVAKDYLCLMGANVSLIKSLEDLSNNASYDILILSDYKDKRDLGEILIKLKNVDFSCTGLLHMLGQLDYTALKAQFLDVYPRKNGISSCMSETLAFLGATPYILLQAASYKVASDLLKGKVNSYAQLL